MKLLSEIQYKAEERKRQVTTSQQVTTFHLPEATQATAGCEYILTIPETQAVSIPGVQHTQIATTQPATVIAKVQQPSRPSSASAQPTSYVVVDDQQPGTSRQMILSSLFGAIPSVLQYQQIDTPQPFLPSQLQPSPLPSSTHQEQSRPSSQSSQQSSQISGLATTSRTKTSPSKGHPNLPKTINNLNVYAQKQKAHRPTLTLPNSTQKKLCE